MAAKPCGCAADPEQTSSLSFPSPREGLQCPELALLPGHSLNLSACTVWMLLWLSFCAGIEGALVPSVSATVRAVPCVPVLGKRLGTVQGKQQPALIPKTRRQEEQRRRCDLSRCSRRRGGGCALQGTKVSTKEKVLASPR